MARGEGGQYGGVPLEVAGGGGDAAPAPAGPLHLAGGRRGRGLHV